MKWSSWHYGLCTVGLLWFFTSPVGMVAPAGTWSSTVERVTLVELYTSEGCSSCPPADAWLSGLKRDPRLWHNIVPLAFHVDYWDYLGWKDRYANAEFSQRQRRYAALAHARTVYTPGFFVNGREWRGFFRRAPLTEPAREAIGVLNLSHSGKTVFDADFRPVVQLDDELMLNFAILGLGIQSEIGAGENTGRKLSHDFVVLDYHTRVAKENDGRYQWRVEIPEWPGDTGHAQAVAAWITKTKDPTPLQAVGGML